MIIKRLYELREDNDLKQKDIAAYLNVAQRTYSGYETGSRDIPLILLIKLAFLYNTSTDYILGLTDEAQPYPRKSQRHFKSHQKSRGKNRGFFKLRDILSHCKS